MKYSGFSVPISYTFAEDVPAELVAVVLENSNVFMGVEEESDTYREYSNTTAFSHILGVVGSISAEEYEYEKLRLQQALNDDEITKEEKNRKAEINFKSKKYNEFWKEEYRRCKYGMTVNGYTITGDNYFFLNFYTLPVVDKNKKSGSGTIDDFPIFFVS